MGTPAIARILDEDGDTIVCVFAQCDGYPESFGDEVVSWISGRKITNGISRDGELASNGLTEMAAHLVRKLKRASPHGHIYLVPAKQKRVWEYRYTISPNKLSGSRFSGWGDDLQIKVEEWVVTGRHKTLYDGKIAGYEHFLKTLKEGA